MSLRRYIRPLDAGRVSTSAKKIPDERLAVIPGAQRRMLRDTAGEADAAVVVGPELGVIVPEEVQRKTETDRSTVSIIVPGQTDVRSIAPTCHDQRRPMPPQ